MNVNDRMIDRITQALPRIPSASEDRRVLAYIATQLEPDRLEQRELNEHGDVRHLREVAEQRLRPYEQEVTHG